ncbi:hypothetical protein [Hyphomicrobium sp.]|uniref:hypothetical protein n=1 Tax=Hyphomicrobium sp. TaxID=82 RepID=UPI001E129056|nr:hypothetical protein [Hyphomicrobium sp.]MBY0561505.1 hypothetical protein [Hyphomicrobium sp.]
MDKSQEEKDREAATKNNGWVARPLCPFCSAPWTDGMIAIEAWCSEGCPTCGHGSETSVTIEIHCEACERLIYTKETRK